MNKREQKQFVKELSATVATQICEQISAGKIPDSWDGHELRALLAYRHKLSADMSLVIRDKRSRRARDFQNTIIVANL